MSTGARGPENPFRVGRFLLERFRSTGLLLIALAGAARAQDQTVNGNLTVAGNASVSSLTSTAGSLKLTGNTPLTAGGTPVFANVSGFGLQLSTYNFGIATNSATTPNFVLDSTGKLGIGTTSPEKKLSVVGGQIGIDNATGLLARDSGGTYRNLVNANADNSVTVGDGGGGWTALRFFPGGAEAMRISADGKVGIGTTAPAAKLDVIGDIRNSYGPVAMALGDWKTLVVAGSSDQFYPVRIPTSGYRRDFIEIMQPFVHADGSWYGSLHFVAQFNNNGWGNVSTVDRLLLNTRNGSNSYIARFADAAFGMIPVVWLRGDQSYEYRVTNEGSLTVVGYDANTLIFGTADHQYDRYVSPMSAPDSTVPMVSASDVAGDLNVFGNLAFAGTLTGGDINVAGKIVQSGTSMNSFSGPITISQPSSSAKYVFTNNQAGAKSYTLRGDILGVSNAGFSLRNDTDDRNEIFVDSSGNFGASGNLIVNGTGTSAFAGAVTAAGQISGPANSRMIMDFAAADYGRLLASNSSGQFTTAIHIVNPINVESTATSNFAGNLAVAGTFSAPNYTASGGAITGGSTGLTLNAGGSEQSITLQPSGYGGTVWAQNTNGQDSYPLKVRNGLLKANDNYLGLLLQSNDAVNPLTGALLLHGGAVGSRRLEIAAFDNGVGPANVVVAYGNLGVGTVTPQTKLDVVSSANAGELTALSLRQAISGNNFNDASTAVALEFRLPNNVDSYGSPAGKIVAGKDNANWTNGALRQGNLQFYTADGNTNNNVERMRIDHLGNVGIGTSNPGSYKLSVNGTIHAKEVVVDQIGWADYVFDENYRNAPLSEVEQHIKEYKHLPGVPSAGEVAEKGVSVGQMQAVLLQKIEELTLHQIEQEKRMSAQDERIAKLEAENSALRSSK